MLEMNSKAEELIAKNRSSTSIYKNQDLTISYLSQPNVEIITDLIKNDYTDSQAYQNTTAVFRRLNAFYSTYNTKFCAYIIVKNNLDNKILGGVGIGSLHGLSPEEGVGEIRDLIVQKDHRGQGIGTTLVRRCIKEAKKIGYTSVYLETTPKMLKAQRLFTHFGFKAIKHNKTPNSLQDTKSLPCYYYLNEIKDEMS